MTDKTKIVIEKALKKYIKAKKNAVLNFVISAPGDTTQEKIANRDNLALDARLYNWNSDTILAISSALQSLGKWPEVGGKAVLIKQ